MTASISHFVSAPTKFSCCSSNKKMSPLFFISRSRPLLPFFSLSFAGLPLFLFFSVFLLLYIPNLCRFAFGFPYLLIEIFHIGMPVVRTDGRAYGHAITKFSRIGRLPYFLTHGAPLRALRARELRYNLIGLPNWVLNLIIPILNTLHL